MTDSQPPPFDRAKSIKTLKYEYDMALATAVQGTRGWEETAVLFALLESFLVHARNLHDFLKPRADPNQRRPGDFWACDFIDDFGYEVFDREMIETINRWLQHITTWRYANDHAQWHASEMLVSIYTGMDQFLADLDEELAAPLLGTHQQVRDALVSAGLLRG